MPKRYHCEFCQKSFQDTPVARKRHLRGAGHQRNRRLHYESFKTDGRSVSERAEILYSELSGEEILQQWLNSHPEVLIQYEEYTRRKKKCLGGDKDRDDKQGDGVESSDCKDTSLLQQHKPSSSSNDSLPLYLEPYRGALPPSLMPVNTRTMTTHPHTLTSDNSTSGWG